MNWLKLLIPGLLSFSAMGQAFEDLSRTQLIDFKESWRQAYVLGLPEGGIQLEQRHRLEAFFQHYIDHAETTNKEDLERNFEYLFYFPGSLFGWSYRFENQFGQDLRQLYQASLSQISIEDPRFLDVMQSLALQIDMREEMIRFPLFADSQFLAGLNEYDRQQLYRLQEMPEDLQTLSEMLAQQEWISFEDYKSLAHFFNESPDAVQSGYFNYLFLGRVERDQAWSEEDFRRHFDETAKKIAQAEAEIYLELTDFYWMLYRTAQRQNWKLDWKDLWITHEDDALKLGGGLWLQSFLAAQWKEFEDASSLSPSDIAAEIKDYIELSGKFSEPEVSRYNESLFLFQTQSLSTLPNLPESIRTLTAISLFPHLPVRSALILMEGRFAQLSLSEQEEIIFDSSLELQDKFEFQIRVRRIPAGDFKQLGELETAFVERLLNQLSVDPQLQWQESVELLNGEQLDTSRKLRLEMREMIELNGSQLNYGFYPRWMIEPLMVHLFPDPDYWSMEWKKAKNEWRRLNTLQQMNDASLSPEDLKNIQELLFDKKGKPKTDYSSPLIYFSSFAHGFVSEPWRALPAAAIGVGFHLVFRGVGGRIVLGLIFGDAGLRIGSAYYFDDQDLAWYEVPVDQGFWTPGQLAAEELQRLGGILKSLVAPRNPSERLWASHDLGQLGTEAMAFSIGAGISEVIGPWSRLIRVRRLQAHQHKLERLSQTRQQVFELEDSASQIWSGTEAASGMSRRFSQKTQTKSRIQRESSVQRLLNLEAQLGTESQGLLGRVASSGKVLFRIGKSIYFLNPLKLFKLKKIKSSLENWKYRRSQSMLLIQRKWTKLQQRAGSLQDQQALSFNQTLKPQFEKFRTAASDLEQKLASFSSGIERLAIRMAEARKLQTAADKYRWVKEFDDAQTRLINSSAQLGEEFEAALRAFDGWSLGSAEVPTVNVEIFQALRAGRQTGSQMRDIQADYALAWQRLRIDSYLHLRDNWLHWRQSWNRHFESSDMAWSQESASGWKRHHQMDKRLETIFKTRDITMRNLIENQQKLESAISSPLSQRFLSLDEYLERIHQSRLMSERVHLRASEAQKFMSQAEKISVDQSPLQLQRTGVGMDIWRYSEGDWIHFLIMDSNGGKLYSGRSFGGRWRAIHQTALSP